MNVKIVLSVCLLLCGFEARAQEARKQVARATGSGGKADPVAHAASQNVTQADTAFVCKIFQTTAKPTFDLLQYLSENLKYPQQALKNEVEGKVYLAFVVGQDGRLTEIEVLRGAGLGHGIPEEAIRLVKDMPKWQPATQSGEVVRSYYTMRIDFTLP